MLYGGEEIGWIVKKGNTENEIYRMIDGVGWRKAFRLNKNISVKLKRDCRIGGGILSTLSKFELLDHV
jgi:hypothetical protein